MCSDKNDMSRVYPTTFRTKQITKQKWFKKEEIIKIAFHYTIDRSAFII